MRQGLMPAWMSKVTAQLRGGWLLGHGPTVTGPWAPSVMLASQILTALASRPGASTLDELASAVGQPRSSVHRVLNTLVHEEFVVRVGVRGGYSLGSKLTRLGAAYLRDFDIVEQFRAVAAPIVWEINETMQLAVLDWPSAIFIGHVDSRRRVRVATEIGGRLPANATAVGKALLAFSSTSFLDRNRNCPMEIVAMTKETITSVDALEADLSEVRARGWAHAFRESEESLCCIAAPVYRSTSSEPVAAMSICVPEPVLSSETERRLAERLLHGCAELSKRLGA